MDKQIITRTCESIKIDSLCCWLDQDLARQKLTASRIRKELQYDGFLIIEIELLSEVQNVARTQSFSGWCRTFLNVVNTKVVNKISLPEDLDSRLRSLDGSFRDKTYWDSSDNPFLVFFEIICETAKYNEKNILIIINSIDSINEEPSNLGNNAYLLLDAIHNIYLNQDGNRPYKLTFLLQGLKSPEDNITESRYTNFLHEFILTLEEKSISSDQSNNSIPSPFPVMHTSNEEIPIGEAETIESPQNSDNDKNINETHKCTRIEQSLLAVIASAIFLSPELRTQIEGIVIFLFAIVSFVLEARLFSWFKDKILDRLCKILKNIWNLFPRLFLLLFILSLIFAFVFHCKIPILKSIIPWCTSCRIADVQDINTINTNLNTFYGGDQLEALKQSINVANKVLEEEKKKCEVSPIKRLAQLALQIIYDRILEKNQLSQEWGNYTFTKFWSIDVNDKYYVAGANQGETSTQNNWLVLWDEKGKILNAENSQNAGQINNVAFMSDNCLITVNNQGGLTPWKIDAESKKLSEGNYSKSDISKINVNLDSQEILAVTNGGAIDIHKMNDSCSLDAQNKKLTEDKVIIAAEFLPNSSNKIIFLTNEGSFMILDREKEKKKETPIGEIFKNDLKTASFQIYNQNLVLAAETTSNEKFIQLFELDLNNKKLTAKGDPHDLDYVVTDLSIASNSKGKVVVGMVGNSGITELYELDSFNKFRDSDDPPYVGSPFSQIYSHHTSIEPMKSIVSNSSRFIAAGEVANVKVLDIRDKKTEDNNLDLESPVKSIVIRPNIDNDNSSSILILEEAEEAEKGGTFTVTKLNLEVNDNFSNRKNIKSIDYSPDGFKIILLDENNNLRTLNPGNAQEYTEDRQELKDLNPDQVIYVPPDPNSFIAIASATDDFVYLRSPDKKHNISTGPVRLIKKLDISSDGKYLGILSENSNSHTPLAIWNINTSENSNDPKSVDSNEISKEIPTGIQDFAFRPESTDFFLLASGKLYMGKIEQNGQEKVILKAINLQLPVELPVNISSELSRVSWQKINLAKWHQPKEGSPDDSDSADPTYLALATEGYVIVLSLENIDFDNPSEVTPITPVVLALFQGQWSEVKDLEFILKKNEEPEIILGDSEGHVRKLSVYPLETLKNKSCTWLDNTTHHDDYCSSPDDSPAS